MSLESSKVVICIGDIHGHITKLQNLWSNIQTLIPPSDFSNAHIIFLGDYCDRGPDTRPVLDFLISLPSKYPNQTHVFLAGNHDFAFAAFVGAIPLPPDGSRFSETWAEFEMNEEREGWYKDYGYENMHLQGRIWAGKFNNAVEGTECLGSIFDAAPTFQSYGVPHGSPDLMKAVPDEHKKFLADLVWIHEESSPLLHGDERQGRGRVTSWDRPNNNKLKIMSLESSKVVICIGDIHGHITKLQNLWSNIQTLIPPSDFSNAHIIFLGDYCDRGPDTRSVLDFLISLPSKYPNQTHVFLAGNHDFAFAAFVGAIPLPPDGSRFSETWAEFEMNEEREGWYKDYGYENMHLQGRIWAGKYNNAVEGIECLGSIFDAAPTFQSYGVPHGSPDLMKAVPDEHKKFLADLVWIHEEDNVSIETDKGIESCKLIAVHAGLVRGEDVGEQIKYLKAKDTRISQVEPLSGRKSVWNIPEELAKTPTIVVSGHHGKLHVDGLRLIIDESGGHEKKPMAAIVLPSKTIVRDTDKLGE